MQTSGPIRYCSGYKYQLSEPWSVVVPIVGQACMIDPWLRLDDEGHLRVAAGYAWDGPSGPTIDTRSFMRGSLAHDALYQLLRAGRLPPECRSVADRVLYDLCRQDDMPWWRADYVYTAVRWFASSAAARKSSTPLVAP